MSEGLSANELFSALSGPALEKLRAAASIKHYARGEVLLRQGDQAQALFFVQAGRFKVVVNGARTVAYIDAGEVVGELAFFAGGKRTADVIATRDASVLRISRAAYQAIAQEHHEVPELLLRLVSERLAQATQSAGSLQWNLPRVIGVVTAGNTQMPDGLVPFLAGEMQRVLGETRQVTPVSEAQLAGQTSYLSWLYTAEQNDDLILVDCQGSDEWQAVASRNIDALLLIADKSLADTRPNDIERRASELISTRNTHLLLLEPRKQAPQSNAAQWLTGRNAGLWHHVDVYKKPDLQRVARFLTGRAVGLVLAGGGALGCAHLGVIAALQAADIPIDYIGGTSAGAAMAAAIASGKSPADTLDQMEAMFVTARALKRLTIPVHSLLDPHEFDRQLEQRYTAIDIAELPLPFFAVSTNLTTSELHVHRRGPLWQAVRASGSLPTILPPFIDDQGHVLVDGGILDNLPVSVMMEQKLGPNIVVALDALDADWKTEARYQDIRTPGKLFKDILLRKSPEPNFPGIFETTQRSMVVTSRMTSRNIDAENNIVLTPPRIEGMQILDWHRGRELADHTEAYISQLIQQDPERFAPLRARIT